MRFVPTVKEQISSAS